MNNLEEAYNENVEKLQVGIKKHIYDVVAVIIIIAILAASLHVFGLADLTDPSQVSIFLMDWIPYLAASMLLNDDLYKKGVFVAKHVKSYITTTDVYGEMVNAFTGEQLDMLPDFCEEYNDKALIRLQREILKPEGISYELFDRELRTMPDELIYQRYNEKVVKLVNKAKNAKVKGINVNTLLSSLDIKDPTNLGDNEATMSRVHTIWSALRYTLATGLMSLVVINDINKWGWSMLIIVVFKIAFLVAGTLMSYFKAYNNITVKLVAHLARKTDVLKEFNNWYNKRNPVVIFENNNVEITENNEVEIIEK